ncbi:MAG TPA: LysR family transcriptional regulator [Verrucomicrobiae bacterium]|nr:LysR family transcriptional regulator [Verrucomicrobiae bacterium]
MKGGPAKRESLQLRLRLLAGKEIALGPGKFELLQLIRETNSISEAARRMKMSYMRAWSLIQTMNRCFREPVIRTMRGGQERGGASLTKTGENLLALYERLESECLAASIQTRREIGSLLKSRF